MIHVKASRGDLKAYQDEILVGAQVVGEHGVVSERLVGGHDHGVALRDVNAQSRDLRVRIKTASENDPTKIKPREAFCKLWASN